MIPSSCHMQITWAASSQSEDLEGKWEGQNGVGGLDLLEEELRLAGDGMLPTSAKNAIRRGISSAPDGVAQAWGLLQRQIETHGPNYVHAIILPEKAFTRHFVNGFLASGVQVYRHWGNASTYSRCCQVPVLVRYTPCPGLPLV